MTEETSVSVKLDYIQRDISEIKDRLEKDYVTRQELDPIKKIVYGLVGLILTSVFGALMFLILK